MDWQVVLLWLCCGLLAAAMHNYSMRRRFHSLYIEGYWCDADIDSRNPSFFVLDFMVAYLLVIAGPVSLVCAVFLVREWGISLRFSKWTQEEAAVLFPGRHTYDLEYRRAR